MSVFSVRNVISACKMLLFKVFVDVLPNAKRQGGKKIRSMFWTKLERKCIRNTSTLVIHVTMKVLREKAV